MMKMIAALLALAVLAACAPQTQQGRQLSCAGTVLGGAVVGGGAGSLFGGGVGTAYTTAAGAGLGALVGTTNPDCQPQVLASTQPRLIGYDQYGRAVYAR